MLRYDILTKREKEVVEKKLKNQKLTHQDSNYLSRFVRPKLKKIIEINAKALLERIDYNPASLGIENKIKKIVLKNIKNPVAIILFGSAIQTNYGIFKDIDVIIVTKNKIWDKQNERIALIVDMEEKAKKQKLPLDIQIISKKTLCSSYPNNPTLIYQLKDCKIIYGKIKIPKKINLTKMDLRMKLDWSCIEDSESESEEIYLGIRNTILVRLLINGIIDNSELRKELIESLGNELIMKLKNNSASKIERMYALKYLNNLTERTRREVINAGWERIKLKNR